MFVTKCWTSFLQLVTPVTIFNGHRTLFKKTKQKATTEMKTSPLVSLKMSEEHITTQLAGENTETYNCCHFIDLISEQTDTVGLPLLFHNNDIPA